jgi:hypothetical protein
MERFWYGGTEVLESIYYCPLISRAQDPPDNSVSPVFFIEFADSGLVAWHDQVLQMIIDPSERMF